VTILALIVFTAIFFSPSPTLPDAASSPDPAPPQPVITQDLSSLLTEARERLLSGQPLNITSVQTPEVLDNPAVPDGDETSPVENSTPIVPEPDYDDDELAALIENSSASLMLLSLQNTHALYSWDEKSVKENAASLHALAKNLLRETERLEVSDLQEPVKTAFTLSPRVVCSSRRDTAGERPSQRDQSGYGSRGAPARFGPSPQGVRGSGSSGAACTTGDRRGQFP